MRPNMVSDELREAMGISHDEIPNHVYRLHEIGYPPSYLNALIDESMKMGDNSRGIINTTPMFRYIDLCT